MRSSVCSVRRLVTRQASPRAGKAYPVVIQRVEPQHVNDVLVWRPALPPLHHLSRAQVARRVHVADLPPPRHLAHVALGDLAGAHILDVGARALLPHHLALLLGRERAAPSHAVADKAVECLVGVRAGSADGGFVAVGIRGGFADDATDCGLCVS